MPFCSDCGQFLDDAHISDTAGCSPPTTSTTIPEVKTYVDQKSGPIEDALINDKLELIGELNQAHLKSDALQSKIDTLTELFQKLADGERQYVKTIDTLQAENERLRESAIRNLKEVRSYVEMCHDPEMLVEIDDELKALEKP
jgi:hypothetical protein